MFNYKITDDKGRTTIVSATNRTSAIRVFCEAEGCSMEYIKTQCKVKKIRQEKKDENEKMQSTNEEIERERNSPDEWLREVSRTRFIRFGR